MEATVSTEMKATPEAIFEHLTQADKLTDWQTFLADAEQVSDGEVGVGTGFRLEIDVKSQFPQAVGVLGTETIVMQGTVTEYNPYQTLQIAGESSYNTMAIRYTCTDAGDGITRLEQHSTFDFKNPLLNAVAPLVKGILVKKGNEGLQRLKMRLEAAS
jgi:uncharacterized protein YndB with AHSA1/START domain